VKGVNIVNIVGGLGNQLFQYLFGQILEKKNGKKTLYDISDFKRYKLHEGFVIEKYFDVSLPKISTKYYRRIPWLCDGYIRKKMVSRIINVCTGKYNIYTDYSFNKYKTKLLNDKDGYYLGYWQSQGYQQEDLEQIGRPLQFKKEIQSESHDIANKMSIDYQNTAAIHIRRRNYINAPSRAPQYALPVKYYRDAMNILSEKMGIRKYYIFSDDIDWAKDNIKEQYEIYYISESIPRSSGIDIYLLSRFTNMIISNSTYGWWAAAMRANKNGIVVFPTPWVKQKYSNNEILYPKAFSGWKSLQILEQ
jgi:hypothetical protein